jgi:hypothetical protein
MAAKKSAKRTSQKKVSKKSPKKTSQKRVSKTSAKKTSAKKTSHKRKAYRVKKDSNSPCAKYNKKSCGSVDPNCNWAKNRGCVGRSGTGQGTVYEGPSMKMRIRSHKRR